MATINKRHYEILKDYESPSLSIKKGTAMEVHGLMKIFPEMSPNDISKCITWFRRVEGKKVRLGFTKVENDFYVNGWEYSKQIFEHIRPTKVEFNEIENKWFITGYCKSFDEVTEGGAIPEYSGTMIRYDTCDTLYLHFDRIN